MQVNDVVDREVEDAKSIRGVARADGIVAEAGLGEAFENGAGM